MEGAYLFDGRGDGGGKKLVILLSGSLIFEEFRGGFLSVMVLLAAVCLNDEG